MKDGPRQRSHGVLKKRNWPHDGKSYLVKLLRSHYNWWLIFINHSAQDLYAYDEEVPNDDKVNKWRCPALHRVTFGSICYAYVNNGNQLKKNLNVFRSSKFQFVRLSLTNSRSLMAFRGFLNFPRSAMPVLLEQSNVRTVEQARYRLHNLLYRLTNFISQGYVN